MLPPGGADSSAERPGLLLSVEVECPPLAVPALPARLERLEKRISTVSEQGSVLTGFQVILANYKGHLPVIRSGGAQGQWTEILCR